MKIQNITLYVLLLIFSGSLQAQIGINTTGDNPDASAMLDISSTEKGALFPRMTANQRDAIQSPATGLLVFVTDDKKFYFFDGINWSPLNTQLNPQDLSSSSNGTDRTINITGGSGTTINVADNDNNSTNEIQDLFVQNDYLKLTKSSSQVYIGDIYQDLSLTGNILRLSASAQTVNLNKYLDNTDEQDLSLSGNILSLSGSSSTVDLSTLQNGDNLGNHILTKTLQTKGKWISYGNDYRGIKLTSSGRVGIGMVSTFSPAELFHVQGGIALFSQNNNRRGLKIITQEDNGDGGGRLFFSEETNSAWGFSLGYNGMAANKILNWDANSFNISKHDNDATGEVVFSIPRASGFVGIGREAPEEQLHVDGNFRLDGDMELNGQLSTADTLIVRAKARFSKNSNQRGVLIEPYERQGEGGGRIFFSEEDDNNWGFSIGYNGLATNDILNWKASSFNISRHGNDATGEVVLSIPRGSGFVGIGTDDPQERLHVADNIRLDGHLGASDTLKLKANRIRLDGGLIIGDDLDVKRQRILFSDAQNNNAKVFLTANDPKGANTGLVVWAVGAPAGNRVFSVLDLNGQTLMGISDDGSLTLKDGNQGAGKVLTSDANGKASWQDPLDRLAYLKDDGSKQIDAQNLNTWWNPGESNPGNSNSTKNASSQMHVSSGDVVIARASFRFQVKNGSNQDDVAFRLRAIPVGGSCGSSSMATGTIEHLDNGDQRGKYALISFQSILEINCSGNYVFVLEVDTSGTDDDLIVDDLRLTAEKY